MASWLVTTSPENFARTRELGFTKQGFKTRQRKNVMERMRPGDTLAYYLTAVQAFAATATVTGSGFEEHDLIWRSKPGEDYPWRIEVAPDIVRDEADWVPSEVLAPSLEHVQRWPAEHWKLAFRGNLHAIPDADFVALRGALAPTRGRGSRPARRPARSEVS